MRVENIVGKGENAGYQHFLFFPQCVGKSFFLMVVKSQECKVKSETIFNFLSKNAFIFRPVKFVV